MKKLAIAGTLLLTLAASPLAVASTEPFVGQTMAAAYSYCPDGWAAMNGQLLSIPQNTALFSLLGTTYGGDGASNFALPTAKPIVTATGATLTQCIALQGIFPPRN